MKMYMRSFLSAFLTGLVGALPLVLIFVMHSLPEIKDLSFEYKRENIQTAVQSVFEILNYYHGQETTGALTKEQAQQQAMNVIKKLRYGGNEYFWINDTHPTMIMHPFKSELDGKDLSEMKDPTGKKLFVEMVQVTGSANKEGFVEYEWSKPKSEKPVPKISYVKKFEPWNWIIGSGVYVDNVLTKVANLQTRDLEYFGIGILILILVNCYNAYSQIKKWIIPVQNVLTSLNDDSKKLHASAIKISHSSNDLSDQVSTQASAIQETVASMEEMSAMLAQSSTQSVLNLNNTIEGDEKSQQTQRNFVKLNHAMDEIENSNHNLDKIISLMNSINEKTKIINDIVFETRLLSFNASIEAARAGIHGKGFSVVSEEIGKLAQVSGKAADEISTLLSTSNKEVRLVVSDIQEKVSSGKQITETCSQDINQITSILKKISSSSEVISKATKEQEIGIKQTNLAMNQMEQVTHKNTTNAGGLAKESAELLKSADSIQKAITNLSNVVKLDENNSQQHNNNVVPFDMNKSTRAA